MSTTFSFKEVTQSKDFDPASLYQSVPFTQAFFYGEWQRYVGREVFRFLVVSSQNDTQKQNDVQKNVESNMESVEGMFQIVLYPLISGKRYAYIPYGPVIAPHISESSFTGLLLSLKVFLKDFSKKKNLIFVRTDFTFSHSFDPEPFLSHIFTKALGVTYHSSFFQPRNEWYLDLSQSTEQIFQGFHKNTRYSVRVAEKKGVSVEIVEKNLSDFFDIFYEVLSETGSRDSFYLHPKEYYRYILKACDTDKNAILVLSSYEGIILAANLVILYGDTAMFIFGGTRNEYRNVMPAYAAQSATISYLQSKKYRWYNFGGVSEDVEDKKGHDSWRGLTAFKKRFGGNFVEHGNFYDVVIQPFWYVLYVLYKTVRR